MSRLCAALVVLTVVTAAGPVAAAGPWGPPGAPGAGPQVSGVALTSMESGAFERWLQSPAALFLTPEEREIVAGLRTDADRAAFVAWFWARRDPDPATASNEFRAQFEERLSYVIKELSRDPTGTGGETDAILYLVLGPPADVYVVEDGCIAEGEFRDLEFWVYDVGHLIGGSLHVPMIELNHRQLLPANVDPLLQRRLRRALDAAVAATVAQPLLELREDVVAEKVDDGIPLEGTLILAADGLHGELRVRLDDLYGEPWQDGVAYWLEIAVRGAGAVDAAEPVRGALSLRVDAERFRRLRDRELVVAVWVDARRLPPDPVLEIREQCTGRVARLAPAGSRQVAAVYRPVELVALAELAGGDGSAVAFVQGGQDPEGDGSVSLARSWAEAEGEPRPWPTGGLRILRDP